MVTHTSLTRRYVKRLLKLCVWIGVVILAQHFSRYVLGVVSILRTTEKECGLMVTKQDKQQEENI